jgi:adenosine deaminase
MIKFNRVASFVSKHKADIRQQQEEGLIGEEFVTNVGDALTLSQEDYDDYQTHLKQAVRSGVFSIEEGLTLQEYLGGEKGTTDKFNSLPVPVKMALIKLLVNLTEGHIKSSKYMPNFPMSTDHL